VIAARPADAIRKVSGSRGWDSGSDLERAQGGSDQVGGTAGAFHPAAG
jgi:hypothetical protein